MIIGSSGTGKTHLAHAVATELGAEFLSVSVADWILLGCSGRGGSPTWPLIARFLRRNAKKTGLVIFVDEIDKIGGQSTWETFLRTEIYSLLDFKIPTGLNDGDDNILTADELAQAQDVFSNRTLILAAGAFQGIWENRSRPSLGFGAMDAGNDETNLSHLAATLPREVTNRFRSQLIVLPQLRECDYRRMLEQSAEKIPVYFRETFLRLGYTRIPGAVACRQGCRFLEELMLDTIIEERSLLQMMENTVLKPVCLDDSALLLPKPLALPTPSAEPDA
ncbi:MAG: ATP-binding protein [Verrucomicrobia bacterium]|nr:ATP-binding protein [Verrucomicrobiota bacterium]